MDCEKLESAMMDEVYGELDELTSAAAKKHIAGCARCAARLGALRSTRLAASLPLEPAPADLEGRVLGAAQRAWAGGIGGPAERAPSVGRRLARAASLVLSLAGSWAMRPQTAMAAVFLVMVGTSLLFLRGKSARAPDTAEVIVTEHGTPAPAFSADPPVRGTGSRALEPSTVAFADDSKASASGGPGRPSYPAPPPTPDAMNRSSGGASAGKGRLASKAALRAAGEEAGNPRFEGALANYRGGRFAEAAHGFDALAAGDPNATLWAARSVREGQGCGAAVSRFDRAARQGRQSSSGWEALFDGAVCYKEMGDYSAARARLGPLLAVESFKGRARSELSRVELLQSQQGDVSMVNAESKSRAAAVAVPAAAAPPPAAPASQADEAAGAAAPR